ncbi:MAG TPA: M55 family metallopeptidase [Terriglobia bacterium]|nr:M55 family metallopeptidase [Terriglobia bacterium]
MEKSFHRVLLTLAFLLALWPTLVVAQGSRPKKVFVITDLEGVDGIFDFNLQCIPDKSPRYAESRKLLTAEVNAAVKGLYEGGAGSVVVYDGHAGGHNLLPFDLDPRADLLAGTPVPPTLELDPSYAAVIFIGLHAMAGTPQAILPHSYTWDIQNIWVNGKKVGEIGGRVMLAGSFGIPAIMLAGDHAACGEFLQLVPQGECAEVKHGVGPTAGFTLTSSAACALIEKKASQAMRRLAEVKPYTVKGPVKVKVELVSSPSARTFTQQPGVEQLDGRTWLFRGNDLTRAWLKFSSF